MIVQTHRLIGDYLYHLIENDPNVSLKLSRRWFVYGNVKPDIIAYYRRMSHYYQYNQEFVYSLLEGLVSQAYTVETLSEDLGVLMHFLTDYTCVYHACEYIRAQHSLQLHLRYEMRFHFYAVRQFKQQRLEKPTLTFDSIEDIMDYVSKLTKQHNTSPYIISESDDFSHLIELTTATLYFILKEREKFRK